jgi:peptide/nickel transport system permease protein
MRRAALAALLLLYTACVALAPQGALPDLALGPPLAAPSAAHPLGTDDLGRDMLAALAQGGRTSLAIGALAAALALALGAAWGFGAAMAGGLPEALLMRAADVAASLPLLLIALLLAAAFGPDDAALALLVGLARAPLVARIARAEARAVQAAGFVRAAWAWGGA